MAIQVDAGSLSGFKSELDLFSLHLIQVAIAKGYWAEYYPLYPVTNTGPYRIFVPKDSFMLDLNKNYLYIKLKIVGNDEADLNPAADGSIDVAPINQLYQFLREHN